MPCPSSDELEGIAIGGDVPSSVRNHVDNCVACRGSLERIREDNQFLSHFAVAGRLLPANVPEPDYRLDIPGYTIVREIHRGGQGVVYQAVQHSTKRDVAIKIMKQGPFATLADRVRFDREIETLGRLNHPHIVAVHDAGTAAGFHYFVMNYVDGRALDEIADSTGADSPSPRQTLGEFIALFCKICDAVHDAHLRGIIHRDLKPSNIRVDQSGQPFVLDFGLAKSAEAQADSMMTQTGQFVGSLPWASPEQVEGASTKVDLRTDVYSLGAILYQLLTGRLPFDVGTNLRRSMDDILHREPPHPGAIAAAAGRATINDELETIVLKCLSKERERRYQSAGDLARDLRRYLIGEPIEAKRDSAIYVLRKTLRRYRRRVAFAAAFMMLFAFSSVVMTLLYRQSTQLEREAVRSAASMAELLSRNQIEQGRMAGLLGNIDQAERLLWRELLTHREGSDSSSLRLNEPPGPPEAYWALWEVYRRNPCRRTITPAPGAMRSVTLSGDGKTIWTADVDGNIQRLDERGERLDGYHVAFPSPLGLPVVDARGDYIFKYDTSCYAVWRRNDLQKPLVELPRSSVLESGGFFVSRSGRRFAAIHDGAAFVWNTDPIGEAGRFEIDGAAILGIAISNDDRRLAARDRLGGLYVWDIESRQRLITALGAAAARENLRVIGGLLFAPDDRRLADGWEETAGRIWDLAADPPDFVELSERPGSHRILSFSPDGSRLAVGDMGGELRVFDAQSGKRLVGIVAHAGRMRSVAFTGDGRGIWTSGDNDLRLWEVEPDAGVRVARIAGESLHGVDISPDGRHIAAGGGMGALQYIDRDSWNVVTAPFGNAAIISAVAFSPDGERIAAATYGNAVFVWSRSDPGRPAMRLEHPGLVSYVSFSPDGARLATACDDGGVRIWRAADGAPEREFRDSNDRVPQLAFDPPGRRLAAAVRNGALLVWKLDTGECEIWRQATHNPLRAVRFSSDGRWLIAAGANRTLEMWDAERGRVEETIAGHRQEIYCVDINRSGEWMASGDAGGNILLWHTPTRRLLATLTGHSGSVMALRFSPDGRTLISASLDGTLRDWDLTYYGRHIAGNFETQFQRLGMMCQGGEEQLVAWRRWAEGYRPAQ
ncbi:MAG TPA: protein kinase [Phycisphaerae bacterium]|nr:protein kinase [Phycisphaerae bacterium]